MHGGKSPRGSRLAPAGSMQMPKATAVPAAVLDEEFDLVHKVHRTSPQPAALPTWQCTRTPPRSRERQLPLGACARRLSHRCCIQRDKHSYLLQLDSTGQDDITEEVTYLPRDGAGVLDGAKGPEFVAVPQMAARLLPGGRRHLCRRRRRHPSSRRSWLRDHYRPTTIRRLSASPPFGREPKASSQFSPLPYATVPQ